MDMEARYGSEPGREEQWRPVSPSLLAAATWEQPQNNPHQFWLVTAKRGLGFPKQTETCFELMIMSGDLAGSFQESLFAELGVFVLSVPCDGLKRTLQRNAMPLSSLSPSGTHA